MKEKIMKMLLIGAIICAYKVLYAPDELKKEGKEGGQIQWVEPSRGWDENGTYLWTAVSPLPNYNVGIGTATPGYKLDVVNTTGNGAIYGNYSGSYGYGAGVIGHGTHDNTITSSKGIIGQVTMPYNPYVGLAVCGYGNADEAIAGWFWGDNIQQATGYFWSGSGIIAVGEDAGVIGNSNYIYGSAFAGYVNGSGSDVLWGYNGYSATYVELATYDAYAIYSNGVKSTCMPTSKGNVTLFCTESPEVLFVDYGSGRLKEGRAYVEIDPVFLETVKIDRNHPYRVIVTPTDECNGVYVVKKDKGFEVIELNGGKSNATFDYQIIAYRKGWEDKRFPERKAKTVKIRSVTREGLLKD